MKHAEKVFKALANRKRLEIVQVLGQGQSHSMLDIAGRIRLSFRSASKHLSQLVAAEILERDRKGRFMEYRINPAGPKLFKAVARVLKRSSMRK